MERREFLKLLGMAAVWPALQACAPAFSEIESKKASDHAMPVWVNDVHSQLNRTYVSDIVRPETINDLQLLVEKARLQKMPLSFCGGRHAMGGQQFGTDMRLIDMRGMNSIFEMDGKKGIITTEAGIQWPELMNYLTDSRKPTVGSKNWLLGQSDAITPLIEGLANDVEQNLTSRWGIRQKPTGTDTITLGGSLSSNVHGRGLKLMPVCADVEGIALVNATGEIVECNRVFNPELFSLALGGYGLFGLIYTVQLRLWIRKKVRRRVSVVRATDLMDAFDKAIANDAIYGDFQFNIDPLSPDFMDKGIFSVYERVNEEDGGVEIPSNQKVLSVAEWGELVYLAHTQPGKAFQKYQDHYLATDGQLYWSDTSQLGPYRDNYHQQVDAKLPKAVPGTEMITELYVPRDELSRFLARAANLLKRQHSQLIYGTVRLIEKDRTTFLPWAKEDYACIIINLHISHASPKIARAKQTFQDLIDIAIVLGGSYYLTYHRWARKDQVLACYPKFPEFLKQKLEFDPEERFQSNWYRHYKAMFA